MTQRAPQDVTRLLAAMSGGDDQAAERFYSLIQTELHAIADRYMRRQPTDHTLQATALVNEAYLRLVKQKDATWEDRAHYLCVAAKAMRSILIDHARRKRSAKRGGDRAAARLDDLATLSAEPALDLVALDAALTKFAESYPQKARIVELRFFGGLSVEETARVMDISTPTVKRHWRMAKAWLRHELGHEGGDHE